jgi:DNA-binding CsgD family transcriptional regulator
MLTSNVLERGRFQADATAVVAVAAAPAAERAFVANVTPCLTVDDLRDWLKRLARAFGFYGARYVHAGHLVSGTRATITGRPIRFLSTAARDRRAADIDDWRFDDPVIGEAAGAFVPFIWSTRVRPEMTEHQRIWLGEERALGIAAGIALPVQDHAAGPAYLSLFGVDEARAAQILDECAPALAFAAAQFHARAKSLLPSLDNCPGAIPLSRRERECLHLTAQGCTIPAIAGELRITVRTVQHHMGRASQKLGAANGLHAVAIAVSEQLIRV